MKSQWIKIVLFASVFVFLYACSKNNGAQDILNKARESYSQKDYQQATALIDSIGKQYPKAFTEIKAGMALLDSVRRGENEMTIRICDSLLITNNSALESLKKQFVYKKDKEFDDIGIYYPKEIYSTSLPQNSMLRSAVNEKGEMYIESMFVGSRKHNQLAVITKDGSKAETVRETNDGLNYSFIHSGRGYETIRFTEMTDNGVIRFISDNADKPMSAQLKGKATDSYTLSQNMKSGIVKTYKLKQLITRQDSLNQEREKSIFKIEYLDGRSKQ